ncbi:MAG: RloB family protein [Planctomycetaceae bacterium]|jgi:hypothetical protein|nr:RloB family protein [Planctomycetaceae bacterium]
MRSYTKSNPEKSVSSPRSQKNEIADFGISDISIKDAGVNYRKEYGEKSPKTFFVIISGGEVREKNYFKIISKQDKFNRIKIEFVADLNQLNPKGLLATAKGKQERYKTSQEDEPDKIFIISDVDHFMKELLNIKPTCEASDISLIISNPCFEIWLYYGKFNQKPDDFIIPENPLKISQEFKRYLNYKFSGGVTPQRAIFDIEAAISNSSINYKEDNNGIPKRFSTNMFRLAEQLLPFIKDELNKMIAENKIKKFPFKKRTI